MRVGIIGSGIAGLTSAWLFSRAGAAVTIFEKHSRLGMDAHCVEFEVADRAFRTDVPPRMFNNLLWPNLSKLYEAIGVDVEPVEPSKSFGISQGSKTLLNLGASFQPKLSPNLILNSESRLILKDIAAMMLAAPRDLKSDLDVTMGQYLTANGYSTPFIRRFLYPALSATLCTCSYEALNNYPAKILLTAMLQLTTPLGLSRTRHGTQDVARRLIEGTSDVRLETDVVQVSRNENQDEVKIKTSDGQTHSFDHLVIATQANAAMNLLPADAEAEKSALATFKYEDVEVVVHTDATLMPPREKDWAHFNFLSAPDRDEAMCSIWLNRFYPEWNLADSVFQTIMPIADADPDLVIRSALMQRPVVNTETAVGIEKINRLHQQANRRTWFCGSYARPGIPLLESGVASAISVASRAGIHWPDECSV